MVRSTDHSSKRAWDSAAGPASASVPETRGAAKGNRRVGTRASLTTLVEPPEVTTWSLPIHSARASTSR